jgi:hypothetical protein
MGYTPYPHTLCVGGMAWECAVDGMPMLNPFIQTCLHVERRLEELT